MQRPAVTGLWCIYSNFCSNTCAVHSGIPNELRSHTWCFRSLACTNNCLSTGESSLRSSFNICWPVYFKKSRCTSSRLWSPSTCHIKWKLLNMIAKPYTAMRWSVTRKLKLSVMMSLNLSCLSTCFYSRVGDGKEELRMLLGHFNKVKNASLSVSCFLVGKEHQRGRGVIRVHLVCW